MRERPLRLPVHRKWSRDHAASTRGRCSEGNPRPPSAMLAPEARLRNAASCKLVGPEPFSRSSRGGARRILAVQSGSVRDPMCAATRSWARSGPMDAAPTVEVGLLDPAATAAAPRRGSGARKNVLVERCRGKGQRAGVFAQTPWRRRHCDRQVLKHRSFEDGRPLPGRSLTVTRTILRPQPLSIAARCWGDGLFNLEVLKHRSFEDGRPLPGRSLTVTRTILRPQPLSIAARCWGDGLFHLARALGRERAESTLFSVF